MAANASIRGNVCQLKLFRDGGDLEVINVKNFEVNQASTFIKSMYVGAQVPVGDQSIEGWEGSLEIDVVDARIDEIIDALVTANLAGVGISDYSMVHTDTYPKGTVKSYVYFDMQFKLSRRVPGMNEKVTQRLEFQAMGRQAL